VARLFIVTINYAPEPSGFAPHATQVAEYLGGRGHDVTVFTGFPFAPQWRRRPDDRGRIAATARAGGVTVRRVTHFIPRRPSSPLQRILMEGSFALAAGAAMTGAVTAGGRPDAILYIGAQPAAAMLARLAGAALRRPYFVRITDLAARAALDVGMLRAPLSRLLDRFEFAAYRKAAGASVLVASFAAALIERGYPAARIQVLHNPIDVGQIRPVPRSGAFRARYAIPPDAFVVLHAGSMGRKQALTAVIAAAAQMRESRCCWVFVGDGEMKAELTDAVRRRGVEDIVRFVPFQPEPELSTMFADADVLLVSQIAAVKDTLIPGKLLTYMAAGRPILAAVNAASEAAQLLDKAGGGVVVTPEDPAALAGAVRRLSALDAAELDKLGARNRVYAEAHFDHRAVLARQEQLLVRQPGTGTPA
jgi:colanic acid biosynthesis glycosyl transferase WcaI